MEIQRKNVITVFSQAALKSATELDDEWKVIHVANLAGGNPKELDKLRSSASNPKPLTRLPANVTEKELEDAKKSLPSLIGGNSKDIMARELDYFGVVSAAERDQKQVRTSEVVFVGCVI